MPYVFVSTDESVRRMQELLLAERAAAAYAVSGLCASYKWRLEFAGACKGMHIRNIEKVPAIDRAYCITLVHGSHVLCAMVHTYTRT